MADNIQILISALLSPDTKLKLQKELDAMSAQAAKSVKTASAKISASAKTTSTSNTVSAQTKSMQKYTAEINNSIHAYKKGEKGVESYNNQLKKLMTYKNFEKLAWKQQEQVVSEYSKSLKIVASNQDAVDKRKIASTNKTITASEAQLKLDKKRFTMLEQINRLQAVKPAVYKDPNVQALLGSTKSAITGMKVGDTASIQNGEKALAKFNTQQQATTKAFANSNTAGKSFFSMIKANAAKVGEWLISTTLIYAPLRALQTGIKYVMELDNALNEIRIVTNMNQAGVENLAKSYGKLAIEMSVSTKEITVQAAELYRQGLATKDVEERMKGIIIYSKISGITIEESGKIITATMNSTGRSIEDVINVFALLGDKTAAGADEIGEALQKVAATADNAGVSLEAAAAMIATISSVTRESAQNIGNSLKSMMSRYGSIKARGFNDEDATNLNDVTKALTAIGIQAVDAQGQLRNFTDVLDDVGSQWESLTKNEQAYLATTMAGTFQRNRYITLMENYSQYTKNYELALDSAGSAQQKFNIYQQSTQAHVDKMTASWQNLIKTFVDSDFIKTIIDIGSSAASVVPQILLLVGAFVAFSSAIKLALASTTIQGWLGGLSVALSTLTKGFLSTTAAATATSVAFGILGSIGIMAAVTAITLIIGEVVKSHQRFKELEQAIIDVNDAYKEFSKTPSEESMANLDNAVQHRIDLLDEEIAKLKERQVFFDNLKTPKEGTSTNYREIMTNVASSFGKTDQDRIADLEIQKQKELEDATYNRIIAEEKLWDAQVMTKKTFESTLPIYKEAIYDMDKYDEAMSGATDAISSTKDELSDLADIYDKVQKDEEISSSNLLDLITKYPQLALQFQNINDLTKNKGAFLKQVWEIEKAVRINEANAAYASAQAQLQAYSDIKFAALNTAKAMGLPMEYYLASVKAIGGKEYEDLVNKVRGIGAQIKIMEGMGIKSFSTSSTKTKKEKAVKDYELPKAITQEIARLDNLISASETKSKEEQIKALEVKEKYLKKIKTQIKDTDTLIKLDGDIIDIQNKQVNLQKDINDEKTKAIELAQDEADAVLKATREIRDSLNEAGKKVSDTVVAGLEDEKTKLEDAKQARLDTIDLEINAINDQIDAQQKQNDLLQEAEDRQEKITAIDIAKSEEKLNLAKILSDLVVAGLEDEKTKLEDAKQARLDTIDLEITAIDAQIAAQQTKNDLLQEETVRQEKLIAIEKEKQNLANILNERNVKVLRDGKWINVADPSAVSDSQETIKDLETDLATWENDLLKTKQIQALEDTKQDYENQKTAISTFHDSQIKSIDKTISDINGIEAEGYAERLIALQGFVDGRMIASAEASTAYSIAVSDSQETIKDLETDLANWENDLLQEKQLQALQDTIQDYEDQKTAISTFYDSQAEIIDAAITNINGIEAEGYTERLLALQGFVDGYNAKVATMLIPTGMTGAGTVSVGSAIDTVASTEMSQADKDALADFATAYSRATTDAERTAAHSGAEAIRAKYGFSGGTNGTKNILLRDSGGVVPHGSTAMNLSGRPELMINNQDTSKLFTFIKSLPSFVLPKSQPQLAMGGSGGITIQNLNVSANNAQEFMISMKNLAILTKR